MIKKLKNVGTVKKNLNLSGAKNTNHAISLKDNTLFLVRFTVPIAALKIDGKSA